MAITCGGDRYIDGSYIPKVWDNLHTVQFMLHTAIGAVTKKSGSRVVLCAGRFDDPQLSDIDLFREARKLGDVLVVGVSGDKGPEKTQEIRAKALAALECVDYVVLFDQDPVELATAVSPAVIVETADYSKADLGEYSEKVVSFTNQQQLNARAA